MNDTPALVWARANLRWTGLPSPAEDVRRLRAAHARIPPKARWPAAILAVLVLAIVVFALVFQWNWLRGPIAGYASASLNRRVTIAGDLVVHPWSLSPSATVNGLTIANPAWAGPGDMAQLPKLTLQVQLLPLLRGQVILPFVELQRPSLRLIRDAKGRANWVFHENQPADVLKLPPIRHFVIRDGALRLDDAERKVTFAGVFSSNEAASGSGRGAFSLNGKGSLHGQAFAASLTGGPLINVKPDSPYPFDARITSGATRLSAVGEIAHPFDLGHFSAQTHMIGPDLSDLYYLTGLALPSTPPYDLTAGFGVAGRYFAFNHIHGRVGVSDLAGSLKVDATQKKPLLTADLASRRLDFADFIAVFGGVPKHTAGRPLSPAQQAMAAKLKVEHRILPDASLRTDRLRTMNARVSYRAQSVEAGKLPIRALSAKVKLQDSVLSFDPLSFTLPQGALSGLLRLDGRGAVPVTAIDMRLTGARLETLMPHSAGPPPLEGGLLARLRLTGAGDSVRAAAAASNGSVSVVIPRGEIRKAFAELLGINATKGLFLLLAKDQSETPVRCAVADFKAENGILTAQRIVLDTGVVLAVGKGEVNLRDETINLRLDGKSKKFRLVHVAAPITLKGRLEAPQVGVELGKAAPQVAVAGLLGLLSPVAAILPFIDPGLAKDADCGALLAESHSQGAPAAATTPARSK